MGTPTGKPTGTPTGTPTDTPITVRDPPPPPGGVAGEYGEYVRKRAAIEAALEKNPTLVQLEPFGGLYEKLAAETYNAEQDAIVKVLGPKKRSDPAKRAYLEKLKISYVFQQTRETVNQLYKSTPQ